MMHRYGYKAYLHPLMTKYYATTGTHYLQNFLSCADCGNIQLRHKCNHFPAFCPYPCSPHKHTSKHNHMHPKKNLVRIQTTKQCLIGRSFLPRFLATDARRYLAQIRVVQVRQNVELDHVVGEHICELERACGEGGCSGWERDRSKSQARADVDFEVTSSGE